MLGGQGQSGAEGTLGEPRGVPVACFIRGQLWPSTRDGPGDRGVEMVFVLRPFAASPGESVPAASPN